MTKQADWRRALPTGRFTKQELQEIYDDYAPTYRQEEWILDRLLGLGRHRRRLFHTARGHVLDVAAGTGANFPYLPRHVQVTAIDLSSGMLALARQRAQELDLNVECQVMDAEQLTFPASYFDTVISTLSTCTFPNPIATLNEMNRVCKPGGAVLLIEHGRSTWPWLTWLQDRTAQRHYRAVGCRWNQEPLDLIERAGLTVVNSTRHLAGLFHVVWAQPAG